MRSLPYWYLSGFYFFHFAFIGAFAPYWSLYLQSLSFNAFQIGVLMSLLQATRIFAPAAWGWLADHTGKRVFIVQLAAITGLISYCGVFLGESFLWIFVVMLFMSFFWSASLPLIEAITLSHLGNNTDRYGRIRSWGSIGFILAVVGTGYLLDRVEIYWLLWVVLGFKLGIAIFSYQIPEAEITTHSTDDDSVRKICNRPEVRAFLVASLLMLFAHGAYYTFYSIYLVENGYDKGIIGWLWAIGVICEIGIFFFMSCLMRHFCLKQILVFSFVCAIVRFLMIGWGVESLFIIVFAQILHAATYGTHHVAAMIVVHHFFRGRHQAKGQAIYTSIAFGIGGTFGSVFSGYSWEWLGPNITFTVSAIAALLGLSLITWKMKALIIDSNKNE
ncbi:MFS transporter, PPP family, 3-phenylpropionic acid transporter [Nitrosomonas cryotolerans]|uniref:MFS transporter, PPP family, 3-phenylpropionic acid transporter n=1 Tax=Nitrosomonas cryotolerans ATCC 49181 TaxID=1131553 RepID=A0A1N6IQV5_9PROT|nr:MFS transporter [Nitrosomonas cryotolerans]SFP34298.1 MFS transporter, PPP family, 3-phenylpropionic acid transporter [Nitrosomonas cryotolerans]SIO34373.1 MFS transporter, PPP family, 3-phenylpropionic acid transporter [Nitrosomonas cryotolerans ATCC 49181]